MTMKNDSTIDRLNTFAISIYEISICTKRLVCTFSDILLYRCNHSTALLSLIELLLLGIDIYRTKSIYIYSYIYTYLCYLTVMT